MITNVGKFLTRLRNHEGGNSALIMALGMPVLIGGTGFAVDTAQWYAWKQELQYATDQAAIAGAWASSEEQTENDYQARALQEFNANLQLTSDFATTPQTSLANYAGGTDNSVIVQASASASLPFSGFLTDRAATINVISQAQFEEGATYTSCIIATDDDDDGAITIGGNATLTAGCGMAALSDSDNAITVNGNPNVSAGYVLAAGGIDDWFDTIDGNTVLENVEGLEDPYENLTPPDNPTPQTFSCPSTSTGATWTADETVTTTITWHYYAGRNEGSASETAYGGSNVGTSYQDFNGGQTYTAQPFDGSNISEDWTRIQGGRDKVWEVERTTVLTEYTNVQSDSGASAGSVQPGTYTSFNVSCDTVMAPGIYVIDGGDFEINAQDSLTGNGVMFVLKNGAGIKINGGAEINLTAMNAAQLIAAGVSADQADDLAGMLIFEDRNSPGNNGNKINGNADTVLNGTVYFPVSNVDFLGTASVTSRCFMLAARTISISGTTDMTSFCPAGDETDTVVASTQSRVRLVA